MSANQPREDTRSAVQRLEGTSSALQQEYTRHYTRVERMWSFMIYIGRRRKT